MSEDRPLRAPDAGTPLAPLALAGFAVATMIGALLPWGTGRVLFISQTVDGFDMDGEWTMAAGAALLAGVCAHVLLRLRSAFFYPYALAAGGVILGVCIYQWTKLESVILELGPFTVEIEPEVSIGSGMLITLISAAGIIAISLLQLVRLWFGRSRAEVSSAREKHLEVD